MKNEFLSPEAAAARIRSGAVMAIAGHHDLLERLPPGRWIGGTTVYFVTEEGGVEDRGRLFCTTFESIRECEIRVLAPEDLSAVTQGYRADGFTMMLMPKASGALARFGLEGAGYPGLFRQPLFGWISGPDPSAVAGSPAALAMVYDGRNGLGAAEGAVVLHAAMAPGRRVELEIVNIFEPDPDPARCFIFEEDGFTAHHARVAGRRVNLARYLAEEGMDIRLPLVADYAGAKINVAIERVDPAQGLVTFYAPVVAGVSYRAAQTLPDYGAAFAARTGGASAEECSYNCVLNYLYGGMEGQRTGALTGPVTYGEIAYILLNQSLVRMRAGPAV